MALVQELLQLADIRLRRECTCTCEVRLFVCLVVLSGVGFRIAGWHAIPWLESHAVTLTYQQRTCNPTSCAP